MFLTPDIVARLKAKDYRDNSIKTINTSIKRIYRDGFGKDVFNIQDLYDTDTFGKYLEKKVPDPGMQRMLTYAGMLVLSIMEGEGKESEESKWYKTLHKQLSRKEARDNVWKNPSAKEKEAYMSFKDIENMRDILYETIKSIKAEEYAGGDTGSMEKRLMYLRYFILCLYTYIPPLRGEDYYNTLIFKSGKEKKDVQNYYLIDEGSLYLSHYKTSTLHGERVISFPRILRDVIEDWYEMVTRKSPIFLPNMKTGLMYNQVDFTLLLKKVFAPKEISVDMLRKIYISDVVSKMGVAERKKVAEIMGHTVETQEFIYNRFHKET